MREVPIPPVLLAHPQIEQAIDQAIAASGLRVTLRTSLRKYPGSIHWHIKRGQESGTLEITLWPQEHRAWFTIQDGRKGEWIEEGLNSILAALERT